MSDQPQRTEEQVPDGRGQVVIGTGRFTLPVVSALQNAEQARRERALQQPKPSISIMGRLRMALTRKPKPKE